jgi:Tol biopolymer transport system component/class 3 adenylate cyclase
MPETTQKRQLAAIMFTDIVGYTVLMGDDEDSAFELLRNNRQLHKEFINDFNGRFLKEMGDGILASFPTVSDAVYCSLAILRKVKEDGQHSLRIGIHSGEVVFENEDVFGDGVNIASRIADNAKEGHVLVSETVYRELGNKKGIKAKFLERATLKHIKGPLNIYWIRDSSEEQVSSDDEESGFSFQKEFIRRNVARPLIAYLAVSMLIIQLARLSFSILPIPEWAFRVLLIVLAFGFAGSIILIWMYERSPTGFIRTSSQNSQTNPYTLNQRKPLAGNGVLYILLLVTSLLYFFPVNRTTYIGFEHLDQFTFNDKLTSSPSWSPDGEWLVYSSNEAGSPNIWKRKFNGGEAVQLTTDPFFSDYSPTWSPNAKSIIFVRGGALRGIYQISSAGGKPTKISNFGLHPSWSPDGSKIVFDWHGSLFSYNFNTNVTDTIVSGLLNPPYAIWLPDNDRIIYWNSVVGKLFIISASTKDKLPLQLIPSGEDVKGLSLSKNGSQLIYSRGAFGGNKGLWSVGFNPVSGSIKGSPKSIRLSITEDTECALSPDGTKIAFTARNKERHLYRIPLDSKTGISLGQPEQLTHKGKLNYYPYIAQDDTIMLMTAHIGGNGLLYRMNLVTKVLEKVTEDYGDSTREVEASMGINGYPIFYSSTLNDAYEIFKQESKGSYPIRLNNPNPDINLVAALVSPDEKSLLCYSSDGGSFNIIKMGVNKGDPEQKLTRLASNEICPTWSPDGREIAYLSDANGNYKIWKMNADGTGQHEFNLPVAREHGWSEWSPDGKWFYYAARVYDHFNIYKVNADGSSMIPITTFQSSDYGLPDDRGYTKFEVTADYLILPLESRSGEIYILRR